MHLGLGVLRLSPRDFWSATPREIAAAVATERAAPPARADLLDLMNRFPDMP
jgi:uncharacterized phage protein (TIGR02216 family)